MRTEVSGNAVNVGECDDDVSKGTSLELSDAASGRILDVLHADNERSGDYTSGVGDAAEGMRWHRTGGRSVHFGGGDAVPSRTPSEPPPKAPEKADPFINWKPTQDEVTNYSLRTDIDL